MVSRTKYHTKPASRVKRGWIFGLNRFQTQEIIHFSLYLKKCIVLKTPIIHYFSHVKKMYSFRLLALTCVARAAASSKISRHSPYHFPPNTKRHRIPAEYGCQQAWDPRCDAGSPSWRLPQAAYTSQKGRRVFAYICLIRNEAETSIQHDPLHTHNSSRPSHKTLDSWAHIQL